MVLYSLYIWLRRARRGPLEAQRRRACMVLLTILSLIFLQSGRHETAIDTWVQMTAVTAANARSLTARLLRPAHAVTPP